jgi:hypothetical protein
MQAACMNTRFTTLTCCLRAPPHNMCASLWLRQGLRVWQKLRDALYG